MTESQMKFIELSKKYEATKESMKTMKLELTDLMVRIGIGNHFQDPEDKTVFQIVKPLGTFISFDNLAYERTKREGEVKGSMSKKKAEELGYIVK
jgi:hypothetical protein